MTITVSTVKKTASMIEKRYGKDAKVCSVIFTIEDFMELAGDRRYNLTVEDAESFIDSMNESIREMIRESSMNTIEQLFDKRV